MHLLVVEQVVENNAVRGRHRRLPLGLAAELQRGRLGEEVLHQGDGVPERIGLRPGPRLQGQRLEQRPQERAGVAQARGGVRRAQLLQLAGAEVRGGPGVLRGHGPHAAGQGGPLVLLRGRGYALCVATEKLTTGASALAHQARLHVPQVHLGEDHGALFLEVAAQVRRDGRALLRLGTTGTQRLREALGVKDDPGRRGRQAAFHNERGAELHGRGQCLRARDEVAQRLLHEAFQRRSCHDRALQDPVGALL
mmetsp:Transcript_9013/g.25232  ORF Transcript_9013/g.25232 Transcript_9013/m.25232 type:complete len:252 (-) Transcript_9013:230-985(-)